MSEFKKIANVADLAPGSAMSADFEGETVALFNVEGKVYVIADDCSHVGGPLSEGEVAGTIVTCPYHGATFDLTNGEAKSAPASAPVTSYQVRIEGDEIQIAAP
ncbi:MAG: 3-phenylpropionate/trans-cinnamate dioxygenase ferredoxin subunit [Planctomycetota bacterium]|jgi:3-phenylpropionate/trans-cinnamate dioxygenase ferredoxin subunit